MGLGLGLGLVVREGRAEFRGEKSGGCREDSGVERV